MRRKTTLLFFLILSFSGGFIVHALFFPALLTNNLTVSAKRIINNKPTPAIATSDKALTHVLFEEGEFDPQVAIVGKSYYLGIINNSDKELMTLTSVNPLFRTPRGYGKSEELLVQLYEGGEYTVSSALHPDKVLKVIVK